MLCLVDNHRYCLSILFYFDVSSLFLANHNHAHTHTQILWTKHNKLIVSIFPFSLSFDFFLMQFN